MQAIISIFLIIFLPLLANAGPRVVVADQLQSTSGASNYTVNYPQLNALSVLGNNKMASTSASGLVVDLPNWFTQDVTGDIAHSLTFLPADGVSVTGITQVIHADPTVDVTGAFYSGIDNTLVFDSANAGFGDVSNMSSLVTRFEHNGSGFINGGVNALDASANFTNAGHTAGFNSVNAGTSVGAGYTIDGYNGFFQVLNSVGGIFGGTNILLGQTALTDIASGNVQGINTSLSVDGASVLSQGIFGGSSTMNVAGTTTVANSINGYSTGITLRDTAATGGMFGYSANIHATDSATSGHVSIEDSNFTGDTNSNINGVTGHQIGLQFNDNATGGNVTGVNNGLTMTGASSLSNYSMYNGSAQLSGAASVGGLNLIGVSSNLTGSGVVNGHDGISMPLTVGGSTNMAGAFEGIFINQILNGSATANAMIGADINILTDNTAAVSGQIAGVKVSVQNNGAAQAGSLVGVSVNLSGANFTDPMQRKGISVVGGLNEFSYDFSVPSAATFLTTNSFNNVLTVDSGSPISSLSFTNGFTGGLNLHDDWSADFTGIHIGFAPIANLYQIVIDAGKTMDSNSGILSGLNNTGGAGTLDQSYSFRAAGVIPGGGALVVNKEVGFEAMLTMCSLSGGNCWAFRDDTSGAENYLGKLAIGTATFKVANSDTAFEIGNKKALLNGRGTTAEKNALTALAGMQFYDTDLSELDWFNGAAWVAASGAGAVTSVTASAPLASTGGTTPDISITQADTVTDGYLSSVDWNTFNNKEPAITATTAADYYRGDKVFATLDTLAVPENTNLYFTDARAIAAPLTGYVSGAGTVAATDSILEAIQKLNGNIAAGTGITQLTGDVTAGPGSGSQAATIAALAVTNAKIANATIDLTAKVTGVLPVANGGRGTEKQEVPSGTINNSNTAFTLTSTPIANATVKLYLNNLILVQGVDYTIAGTAITMTTAPNFAQTLYADYSF